MPLLVKHPSAYAGVLYKVKKGICHSFAYIMNVVCP